MSTSLTAEIHAAVDAVRAASAVCQRVQRALVTADTLEKRDKSPVTVADFASQAVVCRELHRRFPDDPVVGEEDARSLRDEQQAGLRSRVVEAVNDGLDEPADDETVLAWIDRGGHEPGDAPGAGGRYWTLDPIDGTKGFLRREQYAVALGLIENGKVVLGVLGCPNLPSRSGPGVIYLATRGQGARELSLDGREGLSGEAVETSALSDPSAARFCESVESGHSDQDQSVMIAERLGIVSDPVRMDSQCKYAIVARGEAQIYLRLPTRADYREKIWDHAAGLILVEEAGGTVTDVFGKPLDFTHGRTLAQNQGVIATCGGIHAAVVDAVRATMKG